MNINRPYLLRAGLIVVGLLLLAMLSVAMLPEPFHGYVWNSTFTGFAKLLPLTGWTAMRVWTFWAIAGVIIALILKRIDPDFETFDALIGGVAGTWIFAYIAGNLLGPLGLFRFSTIWLIAIGAIVWLWRRPPAFAFSGPSIGQKLALLACVLMAIGTLPLELGSPIPPVMDALNVPASAQRIVTFAKYLPFDNDPYGYWTSLDRVPAVELFYAMLAMGTLTKLAVVAEMAALVPMSCFIIFATYRLGCSLLGDLAGGISSILLLAGTVLTRTESMRGTAVAFALVAVGLAFISDPQRRPVRTAVGALALGTAVASQAIIGGLGIATAGFALVVGLLDSDVTGVLAEGFCLLGALMVAVPEFAVGMNHRLPYPLLPLSQLVGLALICYAASRLGPRPSPGNVIVKCVTVTVVLGLVALLVWSPPSMVMLRGLRDTFPMLLLLCVVGLAASVWLGRKQPTAIWVIAIALLAGCFAEYVTSADWSRFNGAEASFGRGNVGHKIAEYWYPYFLAFPGAVIFDWVYRRWSRWVSIVVLLALVMVPIGPPPNQDIAYMEHPLADEWAWEWLLTKQGWWGGTLDTRWAQGPAELALNDVLRAEIRAGRITTRTHIVHITPHTIIFQDVLLFSLYTGIDDDLYVMKPVAPLDQGDTAGSRLRPISMLPAALAKQPPYLVVHQQVPPWLTLPPAGYDEIFNRGGVRLFRRDDLAPGATAPSSRH